MADIKKEDVLVYLEKANMLEISELIKEIEDKFGVTAVAPVAIAGGAAPADEAGSAEEKAEFDRLLRQRQLRDEQQIEKEDESAKGLNIGMNNGEVAGQTIFHCHVHLIPRREGDVENPRGGVRGVIPNKQKY